MAIVLNWADTDRARLSAVLPDALVVLPVGATEQHGPHLPSGTDTIIAGSLTAAAVRRAGAEAERPLVLAPPLPFGASDHHLEFGATLSLTSETAAAVLIDLARSIAVSGGRRLVLVNGHGGNRGPCHAAAAAATARHRLGVAYLDYWELFRPAQEESPNVPGHAGEFETALITHLHPDIPEPPHRDRQPEVPAVADAFVFTPALWREIDGYTDRPANATVEHGRDWYHRLTEALADRLVQLTRSL